MSLTTNKPVKETFLETYNRELMTSRAAPTPSTYYALPPHIQQLFSPKLFTPSAPDRVTPTRRDYVPTDPTAGFVDHAACIYVHNGSISDLRDVAHAIRTIFTVQGIVPTMYDPTRLNPERLRYTIYSLTDQTSSNGSYKRGIFIDPIASAEEIKDFWQKLTPKRRECFYYFDVIGTLEHKTAYPIESEPLDLVMNTSRQQPVEFEKPSSSRSSPHSVTPRPMQGRLL